MHTRVGDDWKLSAMTWLKQLISSYTLMHRNMSILAIFFAFILFNGLIVFIKFLLSKFEIFDFWLCRMLGVLGFWGFGVR